MEKLREVCKNECYFYDHEKDICDCEIYGDCPMSETETESKERIITVLEEQIALCGPDREHDRQTVYMTADDSKRIVKWLKEQHPKKGMWIVLDDCSNAGIYCSECNNKIFVYPSKPKKKLSNFCPNCGSMNDAFFNPITEKYMRQGETK